MEELGTQREVWEVQGVRGVRGARGGAYPLHHCIYGRAVPSPLVWLYGVQGHDGGPWPRYKSYIFYTAQLYGIVSRNISSLTHSFPMCVCIQ